MAFKSDAHRRWWFANRDAGGGISESSAQREIDAISKQVSAMDSWDNQREREVISNQVAAMDEWENQRARDAIAKQVADMDDWENKRR